MRRRRRSLASDIVVHVVLGLGGLLMVAPFLYQISASLMTQAEVTSIPKKLLPAVPQWRNYVLALEAFPFWQELRITALYTLVQTVSQVLFASMAGYAFARLRFVGSKVIFGVLLSILMIPGELLLISQYQIVAGLNLLNTLAGLVAPGLVTVFGTFMMRQFFIGLPRDLDDAARIDGAGPVTIFFRVLLPLALPGASALAIIVAITSWGAFLWPLVVGTYGDHMTLAVGLATFSGRYATNYPQMMAASLVIMLPVMIFFLVLQRRVIAGLAFAGIRG